MSQTLQRLVSGIQPTGAMHLGNYWGAIKNWVTLQADYQTFFMIADLHSLTSVYDDPSRLRQDRYHLILDLLSVGIDPQKACLFFQSDVPQHAELHLVFSMLTPLPWLERVPSYKSKIDDLKDKDLNTYGFLGYPVLQAADILLYKAHAVPVGKDQLPHLELTREIARRFNFLYGPVFDEPTDLLTVNEVLQGTDGRKMSKSYGNTIPLQCSTENLNKLVMAMVTDPARVRRHDPGNPKVCGVYALHTIYSSKEEQAEIFEGCTSAQLGCVDCKKKCFAVIDSWMGPIREKRAQMENEKGLVDDIRQQGAQKAGQVAQETLNQVKQVIGL